MENALNGKVNVPKLRRTKNESWPFQTCTVDNKLTYHLGVLIPLWVLELLCEILVTIGGAVGLANWIYLVNNIVCENDIYGDYECDGGLAPSQTVLDLGYA